jgi:uncharacterized protein YndB with AHSA1/START domain
MPVTDVDKSHEALTLTITAELPASVERVWQVWADPRQLERWWGPPTHPATFVEHDLAVGGRMRYFMTSPEGERYHGWWEVMSVEEPWSLEFEDGFADEGGTPNPELPTARACVTLSEVGEGRTRMVVASRFASAEAMDQLLAMGVIEGMTGAMGQIDDLLAA